jgi:hypothetical protein
MQLDAREVAIGAGHASPRCRRDDRERHDRGPDINITPLEKSPSIVAPDEPVAAVLIMLATDWRTLGLPEATAICLGAAAAPSARGAGAYG